MKEKIINQHLPMRPIYHDPRDNKIYDIENLISENLELKNRAKLYNDILIKITGVKSEYQAGMVYEFLQEIGVIVDNSI
jgi:hypothetical protein